MNPEHELALRESQWAVDRAELMTWMNERRFTRPQRGELTKMNQRRRDEAEK